MVLRNALQFSLTVDIIVLIVRFVWNIPMRHMLHPICKLFVSQKTIRILINPITNNSTIMNEIKIKISIHVESITHFNLLLDSSRGNVSNSAAVSLPRNASWSYLTLCSPFSSWDWSLSLVALGTECTEVSRTHKSNDRNKGIFYYYCPSLSLITEIWKNTSALLHFVLEVMRRDLLWLFSDRIATISWLNVIGHKTHKSA